MDERRRFNDRERTALYLAADGRCTECGGELEPGWHADHMNPHSKGGPTDVINGQALCPTCNLKKGATSVADLRAWQADALEKFLRSTNDFLCVATPGAGKTRFALAAAERLLERGIVEKLLIVAPTSHMRRQWGGAAARVGIQLDHEFANRTAAVARDYDGIVVTYQSVASQPLLYRRIATQHRTLVVLDEVHHGGDEKVWGTALVEAFGAATRRLLLSGTPDRTGGDPVPFVRYDDQRKFVADYTYDYGQALADRQGVVRLISFPTFDGDTRWIDANQVESKLKLSDVDADSRANALRSALLPDGPWIHSVLVAANEELSRQREIVPDAGGLVVAGDQFKAARYAKTLEHLTGEPVALAVSDMPDASDVISEFAAGVTRWIVAVAMVSEGVDIPRLVVGVYATNKTTDLFFRQVAGRFVRTRHAEDDSCAALFIPSVEPLVGYAADIERTIPRALKEAEERAEREIKSEGAGTLNIEMVVPLQASAAVHVGTILSGESFGDAELRKAEEVALLAGMPPSVTAAQVARLLRVAGIGRTIATTTIDVPAPAEEMSLKEQKRKVRSELTMLAGRLARRTGTPHNHIHGEMNRLFGNTVPTADLKGLRKRVAYLARQLSESQ